MLYAFCRVVILPMTLSESIHPKLPLYLRLASSIISGTDEARHFRSLLRRLIVVSTGVSMIHITLKWSQFGVRSGSRDLFKVW